MALFESLTLEAVPYVLPEHREDTYEGVQPVFGLMPQTARQMQLYYIRRDAALGKGRAPDEKRASDASDIDEEFLCAVLKYGRNMYQDGDEITDAEGIAKIVPQLDLSQLQRLILAASSRSMLEEGAKNS